MLDKFVNQREAIRLFAEALHAGDMKSRIIYFYGEAGSGKSILLRYLHRECSHYLPTDDWQFVTSLDVDNFVSHYVGATHAEKTPSILLDFDVGTSELDPQNSFGGVVTIRKLFEKFGYEFSVFDYANFLYLFKTGQLSSESIETKYEYLEHIFKHYDPLPVDDIAVDEFEKRFSEHLILYLKQRGLDKELVQRINNWDARTELVAHLPELLANDLRQQTKVNNGLPTVIFLDTHDAFWGEEYDLSNARYFERDEWVRCFISTLKDDSNILIVISGRDIPRWAQAAKYQIPAEDMQLIKLKPFRKEDASHYLKLNGIEDRNTCEMIINYVQAKSNEIHPQFLALCVDAFLALNTVVEQQKFLLLARQIDGNLNQIIVERFLSNVSQEISFAIYTLAACRSFTREIYFSLGDALHFRASEPLFRQLVRYSFIHETTYADDDVYRVHSLLKRLIRDQDSPDTRQSDEFLSRYYKERAEKTGHIVDIVTSIFHTGKLDWSKGVEEWRENFQRGLDESNYQICRTLLDLKYADPPDNLNFLAPLAKVQAYRLEGEYFATLGRLPEAFDAYDSGLNLAITDDFFTQDSYKNYEEAAMINYGLAQLAIVKMDVAQAMKHFTNGLNILDRGADIEPMGSIFGLTKARVRTLLGIADIKLSFFGDRDEARLFYTRVVESVDFLAEAGEVLDTDLLIVKALAIRGLGQYLFLDSDVEEAINYYKRAESTLDVDADNQRAEKSINFYLGTTTLIIADTYAFLRKKEEAIEYYNLSIRWLEKALSFAPSDFYILEKLATAHRALGNWHILEAETGNTEKHYFASVAACDKVLAHTNGHILANLEKAETLLRFGQLKVRVDAVKEAKIIFEQRVLYIFAQKCAIRSSSNNILPAD